MVSATRCPPWSDQVKKLTKSRAAYPKGKVYLVIEGGFEVRRAEFRPSRGDKTYTTPLPTCKASKRRAAAMKKWRVVVELDPHSDP